jgi:hypothetical protein
MLQFDPSTSTRQKQLECPRVAEGDIPTHIQVAKTVSQIHEPVGNKNQNFDVTRRLVTRFI